MGKFYSAAIATTDPLERVTSISEWFNNLEGISSEVIDYTYNNATYKSANITIDGTDIEMLFGILNGRLGTVVVHARNGETTILPDSYENGADGRVLPAKLYAYIDDNCIVLSVFQANDYNPSDNGIEIVYLKTLDNKNLIGYIVLSYDTTGRYVDFANISSLTFEEVTDTSRVPYKYINMFPYNAEAGTIDYTIGGIFVDGAQFKHFKTEALVECSTVSLLTTQSLIIGNCIALGTHCLAPLDMEEEEESE